MALGVHRQPVAFPGVPVLDDVALHVEGNDARSGRSSAVVFAETTRTCRKQDLSVAHRNPENAS